jgi:hypothetical protein
MAGRGGVLYGVAGHHNLEHGCAVVSAALNVAPLSMKSVLASYTLSLAVFIPISGWMADRFGNASSVRIRDRALYSRIRALRHIERHPSIGRLSGPAGMRRSHDGPGGSPHPGANVRQIRAYPRYELRRDSRSDRPNARADRRRSYRRIPDNGGLYFL